MKRRAGNGYVEFDNLAWNAQHHMNSQFEPTRMQPVCQRLESFASIGRWKSFNFRNESSTCIPCVCFGRVGILRVSNVPAVIEHRILPPEGAKPGHLRGIGAKISLTNGGSVRIPRAPAHRWRRGWRLCMRVTYG